MDLSIVIPAFNEANKIRRDIETAAAFMDEEALEGEVIVADDGSADRTSDEAEQAHIPESVKLNVIRLDKNRGKGFAVKKGVLVSKGDVVLYADSGTCVPYTNALKQMERIRSGELDIAVASRRHKETVILRDRSFKRRVLSWFFRQVAILVTGLPKRFTDTQCGFKIYKGEVARELFGKCRTSGFMFELEILLRALKQGYRIEEFPVEWTCDLDTRLRPANHAGGVAKELLSIRSMMKKVRTDRQKKSN
jgi:dolichyl-phosphate beta-glucosyltransferase